MHHTTTYAEWVAHEVAASYDQATATGRDVTVRDGDLAGARRLATKLGAVDTTARPSALFGFQVVTVWMETSA